MVADREHDVGAATDKTAVGRDSKLLWGHDREPTPCIGVTDRADESLPGQQLRRSILGSDPAGGAAPILAVNTGGRGHRV